MLELLINRRARARFQIDQTLFATNGDLVFANYYAAQQVAQRISGAGIPARAADINAMGLIHELAHIAIQRYKLSRNPNVLRDALDHLSDAVGESNVQRALREFVDLFPAQPVFLGALTPQQYLNASTDGTPNREVVLEEMTLVWLANNNPAFAPYRELFDDTRLREATQYVPMMARLPEFFDGQPSVDTPRGKLSLFAALRAPIDASPLSLEGQLDIIREVWAPLLGDRVALLNRLLIGLDIIREEGRAMLAGRGEMGFAGDGNRLAQPPRFDAAFFSEMTGSAGGATVGAGGPDGESSGPGAPVGMFEPEAYTPDQAWMPNVVMIAKSSYVWLDQLSKKYGRPITRLDQIPDAELDQLARWGITGLWLIGLWERSLASQTIKQKMGNPEAIASAYSLKDYVIAADLGGDAALADLKARAWTRGIRLASDMVPNHTGLDATWVAEHPEWFLSAAQPPYPNYTYNGPNLSSDSRVAVYLEDHYYDRKDAAVAFKRVDAATGEARYLYHGNDGTGLPWNDTAQIDYLNPVAREQVIQSILNVAKQFPIIRFDAAMVLAKRHIQRLWYPEPGSGTGIASRAAHAMSKADFDALMPKEFWREVVDRAALEAPETLLLAEAFWMLEGYFVRTLGMHRVYNSAFMIMLRDEDNAGYRRVMRDTLEFDPQIINRYVNFLNNPDEKTAVEQFGKADKYFGVCAMAATLPGLPMLGHGQFEGFTEKYGMEYRRAYYNEIPDAGFIAHHERVIVPILKKRRVFAGSENFLLYDFVADGGGVDENVYAYSNGDGSERGLFLFNNRQATTRGSVKHSVAFAQKTGEGDEKILVTRALGDGLRVTDAANRFVIFRDQFNGLEYLRNSRDIVANGMRFDLGPYECQAFTGFREVVDTDGRYASLNAALAGGGVPDIEEAIRMAWLQPLHGAYRALVNARHFNELLAAAPTPPEAMMNTLEARCRALYAEASALAGARIRPEAVTAVARETRLEVERALATKHVIDTPEKWSFSLPWLFTHLLGQFTPEGQAADPAGLARARMDEWRLSGIIESALRDFGRSSDEAWRAAALVKALVTHQDWHRKTAAEAPAILRALAADSDVRNHWRVNEFQGVTYFNHEGFEELLARMLLIGGIDIAPEPGPKHEKLARFFAAYDALRAAVPASDYDLNKLVREVTQA